MQEVLKVIQRCAAELDHEKVQKIAATPAISAITANEAVTVVVINTCYK